MLLYENNDEEEKNMKKKKHIEKLIFSLKTSLVVVNNDF
jgi:hypothetical protein